jgi:uncharacterized protein (DUF111 family)
MAFDYPGDGGRRQHEGSLLFVQIDHLSGDLLGEALTRLCSVGAMNVQLLPTLTKKGRPGQLLLIDVRHDQLASVEETLLAEFGVTGWHRLVTQHVVFSTENLSRNLTVLTAAGTLREQVEGKRMTNPPGPVVPEHRSCVALCERLLAECGMRVPLREIVRLVSGALNGDGEPRIDLRGKQGKSRRGSSDE